MAKDKKTSISVQGTAITILSHKAEDYISLTDMVKHFDGASKKMKTAACRWAGTSTARWPS